MYVAKKGKKVNLSDLAYEKIKDMILHLEIKPGERVPEEKIVGMVDGSRTPVREALRQLSSEGLVNIYPRRYAEVVSFDDKAAKQIGIVRLSQDILACQLVIKYATDEELRELRDHAIAAEEAVHLGDIYQRISQDLDFHRFMARLTRNQLLIDQANKTYLLVHLIQISRYTSEQDTSHYMRNSVDIVDALAARDLPKACRETCLHIRDIFGLDREVIDYYSKA